MTNERAKSELMQLYGSLSEEKKKALDVAFKAMEQADGNLITVLCSLPKIQSSDGQEYVQLADVLETVRRYKPSVAIPNKIGEWLFKEVTEEYHVIGQCSKCKERRRIDNYCSNCGSYNGD